MAAMGKKQGELINHAIYLVTRAHEYIAMSAEFSSQAQLSCCRFSAIFSITFI